MDVPERFYEMGVIEMSVDAEHLAPCSAYVARERLWEAGCLAEPIAAGKIGESTVEGGRAGGNGALVSRNVGSWVAGLEGRSASAKGRIRGERVRVMDLADNPALHQHDVLTGWDTNGIALIVEPGVGIVTAMNLSLLPHKARDEKLELLTDQQTL